MSDEQIHAVLINTVKLFELFELFFRYFNNSFPQGLLFPMGFLIPINVFFHIVLLSELSAFQGLNEERLYDLRKGFLHQNLPDHVSFIV